MIWVAGMFANGKKACLLDRDQLFGACVVVVDMQANDPQSAPSSAPAGGPALQWLRYLAPLLLATLVMLLGQLQAIVPLLPRFSTTTLLVVAVAPLAELYYLWQRPPQFRYPLLLSISLLGFHAGLGLAYWVNARQGHPLLIVADWSLGDLVGLIGTVTAGMVLVVYWLRSWHKHPKRWPDLVKLVLATGLFGGFPALRLLRQWAAGWLPPDGELRIWLGLLALGTAGLFVLVHLIEVLLLPPRVEPTTYEEMIDEIQAEE